MTEATYRIVATNEYALARRSQAIARHARVFSWRNVLWAIALAALRRLRPDKSYETPPPDDTRIPVSDVAVPDGMVLIRGAAAKYQVECGDCTAVFQYDVRQHVDPNRGWPMVKCPACGRSVMHSDGKPVKPSTSR